MRTDCKVEARNREAHDIGESTEREGREERRREERRREKKRREAGAEQRLGGENGGERGGRSIVDGARCRTAGK